MRWIGAKFASWAQTQLRNSFVRRGSLIRDFSCRKHNVGLDQKVEGSNPSSPANKMHAFHEKRPSMETNDDARRAARAPRNSARLRRHSHAGELRRYKDTR